MLIPEPSSQPQAGLLNCIHIHTHIQVTLWGVAAGNRLFCEFLSSAGSQRSHYKFGKIDFGHPGRLLDPAIHSSRALAEVWTISCGLSGSGQQIKVRLLVFWYLVFLFLSGEWPLHLPFLALALLEATLLTVPL